MRTLRFSPHAPSSRSRQIPPNLLRKLIPIPPQLQLADLVDVEQGLAVFREIRPGKKPLVELRPEIVIVQE
jgi:hypothetical protein